MTALYALLVGIDRYAAPDVPDLRGCVRDVTEAAAHLERAFTGAELCVKTLLDGEGSRTAVIEAIRTHLCRATPEDSALFWFSGHGSSARCPEWAWFAEPTERVQTLVCADSRTSGVPDLWDKELSILLDEVARHAAHVAVVLDSCHSDGATRGVHTDVTAVRSVPEAPPRDRASLLRNVINAGDGPEHIAMAACRSTERAWEAVLDGGVRGVFSWSLLRALELLGPDATYRELTVAARAEVQGRVAGQSPQLRPAASALADHAFLSARPGPSGAALWMRHLHGEWEIDAGAVHGMPLGQGLRVGVRDGTPAQQAAVIEVQAHRSVVEPAGGWQPARHRPYPMVVTHVPVPPLTVAVGGTDPGAVRRLLLDLRTAGPGGGPSPHVREAGPGGADLRAQAGSSGTVSLADRYGHHLAEVRAEEAVGTLAHIARWTRLSTLTNPRSELTGSVRIEVLDAAPGVPVVPHTGGPVREPVDGELRLGCRRGASGWLPPEVFIRLHNTSRRWLYCVLLDLTSGFRVHAELFSGSFIAPGARGAARQGRPIRACLPDGMAVTPGTRVRDRLVLVVAEEQFSADPFLLPALGERVVRRRGEPGSRGLLERIVDDWGPRDLDGADPDPGAYDWTTESVTLISEPPR
jgi:hypothetical protein